MTIIQVTNKVFTFFTIEILLDTDNLSISTSFKRIGILLW